MKNATNLRLVVSNSCVDLFEKCMRTDPLLRLFDEPKLRHLLHGILGEPPYQNFADYCNATLKRKSSAGVSLDDALAKTAKNYFFAQFTKVFVRSPKISSTVCIEVESCIETNMSRLQKTTSSPSSRRYLLGHLKFPALYVSKLNLASRPI